MKAFAALPCLAAGMLLSGCASIFEGTTQEITVVTNPPGASCSFERQGKEVGTISRTPGTANIRKSKYDVSIYCEKPGYQRAEYLNHSGTSAYIAGNIAADLILTAGISSIVDSARGADNKYDSAVNMTLVPTYSYVPQPPPPVSYAPPSAPLSVQQAPAPVAVPASQPTTAPLLPLPQMGGSQTPERNPLLKGTEAQQVTK